MARKFIMLAAVVLMILVWTGGCSSGRFSGIKESGTETVRAAGDAGDYLPGEGLGPGWKKGKVNRYTRKNLYEYINGEAELYFGYHFRELVTAVYYYEGYDDPVMTVDIYCMGSPLDAFGIYSCYRRIDSEGVSFGAEGIIDDYHLLFYQGSYFIKIATGGEPEVNRDFMTVGARRTEERIGGSKEKPPELNAVRIDYLIPRSQRYSPRGVLGYSFFPSGIEAEAVVDSENARYFVIFCRNKKEAGAAFRKYLRSAGQSVSRGQVSFSGTDPYYGEIFIEQREARLAGVIAEKEETREAVMSKLRERLN